jgi:prepilin-type N-terminal cleavage/methylation domain-containing protein
MNTFEFKICRRGFTLIELVVVLVVIGLVIGILAKVFTSPLMSTRTQARYQQMIIGFRAIMGGYQKCVMDGKSAAWCTHTAATPGAVVFDNLLSGGYLSQWPQVDYYDATTGAKTYLNANDYQKDMNGDMLQDAIVEIINVPHDDCDYINNLRRDFENGVINAFAWHGPNLQSTQLYYGSREMHGPICTESISAGSHDMSILIGYR